MSVLFLSSFILALLPTSICSMFLRRDVKLRIEDFIFSLSLVILILGGCLFYYPKLANVSILTIQIFALSLSLYLFFLRKISLNFDTSIFYFLGLIVFFVVILNFEVSQKFFVNPDPYGYAAVTGLSEKYQGLGNGFNAIAKYTGVPFNYDANWTDATQFKNIASPFHIPDFLLKYGVSNGMFLHNAGSSLGLITNNFNNRVEAFFWMWQSVTLLALCACIVLVGRISIILLEVYISRINVSKPKKPNKNANNSYVTKVCSHHLNYLISIALLLGAVWVIPMFWEGFLNQILSYAITLCFIVSIFQRGNSFVFGRRFLMSLILPIVLFGALIVVYAQQVFWAILGVFSFGIYFYWEAITSSRKRIFSLVGLVVLAVPFMFLIPQTRRGLEMFISPNPSSGAGGSTHLGFWNPIRAFINPFFAGLEISNPGIGDNNIFKKKVWPDSAFDNNFYELIGQGYYLYADSISKVYLTGILLISIFLIYSYRKRNLGFLGLSIIPLSLVFSNLIYLYTHSGEYLRTHMNSIFNDYLWMRLWAISSLLIAPIIVFILVMYISKLKNKAHKLTAFSICILVLLNGLLSVFSQVASLNKFSINSAIVKNCPSVLERENNYYVSTSIVPVLGIAICGKSMEFLSDSFPSMHQNEKARQVIGIFLKNNKWEIKEIGRLRLANPIQSPCDLECVKNQAGFDSKK